MGGSVPLAVVRANAVSILACVQVWSDFTYSQCTNQYYCPVPTTCLCFNA